MNYWMTDKTTQPTDDKTTQQKLDALMDSGVSQSMYGLMIPDDKPKDKDSNN